MKGSIPKKLRGYPTNAHYLVLIANMHTFPPWRLGANRAAWTTETPSMPSIRLASIWHSSGCSGRIMA
jgi:hypothetical protein